MTCGDATQLAVPQLVHSDFPSTLIANCTLSKTLGSNSPSISAAIEHRWAVLGIITDVPFAAGKAMVATMWMAGIVVLFAQESRSSQAAFGVRAFLG